LSSTNAHGQINKQQFKLRRERMENSSASLKEHLMAIDPEFGELALEHQRYEARLKELTSLQYPTPEEMMEETLLKKKKLLIKDKMEAILNRYKRQIAAR